jgi:5-methylcytosine-specific restriction protein A
MISSEILNHAVQDLINTYRTGLRDYKWDLRQHRFFLQTNEASYPWLSLTELLRQRSANWPRQSGPDTMTAITALKELGYEPVDMEHPDFDAYWSSYVSCCTLNHTSPSGGDKNPPKKRTFVTAPTPPNTDDIRRAFTEFENTPTPPGFGRPKSWYIYDPKSGKDFPLKIIWGLATGQRGKDFVNTRHLRKQIEKLGFPCVELAPSDRAPSYDNTAPPLLEGAEQQVTRVEKERNPAARKLCIEHHRNSNSGRLPCAICDMDFAETYGPLGEGFIHIHHIEQLSKRSGEYQIDPIKDLIPVCPNCHAMIHRYGENRSIEELKSLLQTQTR